jgi:UDP-galactopyranose mutase
VFVIVGAGLTGATLARSLTDKGYDVKVVETRLRPAGNCHDSKIAGQWVHTHGPHYFRTNSERIYDFVKRFAVWQRFEPIVKTNPGDGLYPWPGLPDNGSRSPGGDTAFERAARDKMPLDYWERFVKGYNLKQWGTLDLDPKLLNRFQLGGGEKFRTEKYQGIPANGYTAMIDRMLDGIEVEYGSDYVYEVNDPHVLYTGPIDHFFGYEDGPLKYRAQKRDIMILQGPGPMSPAIQVNFPSLDKPYIRRIEWNHLSGNWNNIVLTYETPIDAVGKDGEYPFPGDRRLFDHYKSLTPANVTFCGRLGEYRYLDMDQAIARALKIADEVHKV